MNDLALNNLVTEIKFFENQAVVSYWEIGKRLAQAKEQVEHGNFEKWTNQNLGYSRSMTKNLLKVYKEYPNVQSFGHLNFSQMIALASVDEETRQEIIEKENLEDKTVRETKEIIRRYKKEKEELEEENKGLRKANAELSLLAEKEPEIIEKTVTKEIVKEVIPSDYERIKMENRALHEKNAKLELDVKVSKLNDSEEAEKLKSELRNYKWMILNFVKNVTPFLNLVEEMKALPKEEQELIKNSTKNLLGFASNLYEQIKGE